MVPNASSIDPGEKRRLDRRSDEQLKRVDVLRDRGPLPREVGLRRREDLLGLVEVGARRDSAFEAEARQADALLRARRRSAAEISSRLESAA